MNSRVKKAAFINAHRHPSTDKILELLKSNYSDYQFDIIQLDSILSKKLLVIFINAFYTLWEHGIRVFRNKKKFVQAFMTTTYIFKLVKKIAAELIGGDNYVFSFQIGSLFDTSFQGVPHFIYTDNTFKANLNSPMFTKGDLPSKKWLALERTIYLNTTLNFTRSTNVNESIINDYNTDPEKAINIYAGYNVPDNKPIVMNNDNYSNKTFLFVGGDWERKGGPELINAFKKVLDVHPDAHLKIVGCSPDISVTNVEILGKLDLENLYDYYTTSSIFILPSRLEPFGVAFLEAMYFKLPVIATNIQALPDFIKPGVNGYLAEPGDSEALFQFMVDLLNDPQKCRKMGEEGSKLVYEKYNWENVRILLKENIDKFIKD